MDSERIGAARHRLAQTSALNQHGSALGLPDAIMQRAAASPLAGPLAKLWGVLAGHPDADALLAHVVAECKRRSDRKTLTGEIWDCRSPSEFISAFSALFMAWVHVVPVPNDPTTDELYWIQRIDWLFVNSPTALGLVRGAQVAGQEAASCAQPLDIGREDLSAAFTRFLLEFNAVRAAFLESPASAAAIADWLNDPRAETEDFALQDSADYASWNAYFTRRLRDAERSVAHPSEIAVADGKSDGPDTRSTAPTVAAPQADDGPSPARPVAHPERAWLISAPTDCIIEPLSAITEGAAPGPLALHTSLAIKGQPFSVERLLGHAPDALKAEFIGGHGYTCVLLPTGYHHFHAPVSGRVVYTELIQGGSYGLADRSGLPAIQKDRLQEATADHVPRSTTMPPPIAAPTVESDSGALNVQQFEWFTRGVVIIEVGSDERSSDAHCGPASDAAAGHPVTPSETRAAAANLKNAPGRAHAVEAASAPAAPASDGLDAQASKAPNTNGVPRRGQPRGWVVSIPVGLNTIGSVNLSPDIAPGAVVRRGDTRLGHFAYGGSLNILLFSAGLLEPGVRVRLGAQIGVMR